MPASSLEPGLPLTIEEWAELDEDVSGELVDGRLVEEEMPTVLHEAIVAWFMRVLGMWVVARGGWAFGSEHKLAVAPRRGRKPDLTVYFPGTPPPARSASMSRRPPSLVVEVLTSRPRDARRDRVEKLAEYAEFGVGQYWIVDPEARVLQVLALRERGRYEIALSAGDGAHSVPGCEGLVVDLGALWSEVDRLPEDDEESI